MQPFCFLIVKSILQTNPFLNYLLYYTTCLPAVIVGGKVSTRGKPLKHTWSLYKKKQTFPAFSLPERTVLLYLHHNLFKLI